MSLSPETLSALQTLMAQDATLMARVQTTPNTTQAAALIAEAAEKNGIVVNEAELSNHLEAVSHTLTSQALSDRQLDAVAGGGFMPPMDNMSLNDDARMALLSVHTLGLGCAVISISHAAGEMMGFTKKFC